MAPLPLTGSNARSVAMQLTQVAYGGCWKCLHVWQRCSASTPRLAASQKGFVNSFATGIGLLTLVQSLRATVGSSSRERRSSDMRASMLVPGGDVKAVDREVQLSGAQRLTCDTYPSPCAMTAWAGINFLLATVTWVLAEATGAGSSAEFEHRLARATPCSASRARSPSGSRNGHSVGAPPAIRARALRRGGQQHGHRCRPVYQDAHRSRWADQETAGVARRTHPGDARPHRCARWQAVQLHHGHVGSRAAAGTGG